MYQLNKITIRSFLASILDSIGVIDFKLQMGKPRPWAILMYHRIINPADAPYPLESGMYVTPETFLMQMEYLATNCKVISLDTLTNKILANDPIHPATVVLTFDDGWLDNYTHAFPILQKYSLPATIFLATSYVDSKSLFWTDKVAMLAKSLSTLDLQTSSYSGPLLELLSKAEKQSSVEDSLTSLLTTLKTLSPQMRQSLLENCVHIDQTNISRQFLNWQEVESMHTAGIAFGNHSHTHPLFSTLTKEEICFEFTSANKTLQKHNITPSKVFCYPGGSYSSTSQNFLNELQVPFALSVDKHPPPQSLPLLLPRTGIHEDISNTLALFKSRIWL